MAKGSKKLKTVPLRMKVSPILYEYLGVLVGKTLMGASENDVATHILTERLQELKDSGYPENPHGSTGQN